MEQLDQLKEIGAPVFVVDYADKDWQDVTEKLGEVTGHEQQAEDVVKKYEDKLAEVKDAIELPEQPTTALNYNPQPGRLRLQGQHLDRQVRAGPDARGARLRADHRAR